MDMKNSNYNVYNNPEDSEKTNRISQMDNFDSVKRDESKTLKKNKLNIIKNFGVICFSFTFIFTAYTSMSNLQSSINAEDGLGTYSLATLYGTIVLSSSYLPSLLIDKFSVKWTLMFCQLTYSIYILAQFYPSFYTLIPGSAILGTGAAPMWVSKGTYVTQISYTYAELAKDKAEVVLVRSFSIFFLFFQTGTVLGNVISSTVLESPETIINEEELDKCGINYRPWLAEASNNTNLDRPPNAQIYTLAGIFLASSLTGATLTALFLDPLTRWQNTEQEQEKKKPLQLANATFRHLRNIYQILMIAITIWSGFEQGYFGSVFTRAFVSCAHGAEYIGYIFICYGVVNGVCCLACGPIVRFFGRMVVFTIGVLLNTASIILMFLWEPDPDNMVTLYVIAGLWGAADAVWQTQINAFYGLLFKDNKEAAFSNYRLWESVGFILSYALVNETSTRTQTWLAAAILAAGVLGYFTIEILEFKKSKK